MAEELAQRKAQAVLSFTREAAHNRETNTEWILAADTVVAVGADVMGKPTDRDEAERFLSRLSGVDHHVHTGVALVPPDGDPSDAVLQTATTTVTFAPLSQAERIWYLDTEEWRGVAGGYRIQARGACLIASICGSYSNVVGLPIRLVYSMLASNGFVF
jgi:septum formation protein